MRWYKTGLIDHPVIPSRQENPEKTIKKTVAIIIVIVVVDIAVLFVVIVCTIRTDSVIFCSVAVCYLRLK